MNKQIKLIIGAILLILLISFSWSIIEENPATDILVVQGIGGGMKVVTTPGPALQNFGTVTHYKKSFLMSFSKDSSEGELVDQSIKVRFNDGGHANLSGSMRVDLPLDEKSILALHTKYGSQLAIENSLIKQIISRSVYMTGPMMSSKESSSEKRNDLLSYIEDQAINGVYKTVVVNTKVKDPMDTTLERTIGIVQIRKDEKGVFLRQESSPASEFNIRLYNLSINSIDYDPMVEKQIITQQNAVMQVSTAIAQAKQAEQQAYTAAKQGEAEAAKAKWAQEVVKATEVTKAQQELEVATLAKKTAEQNKQALILKGEGEASYKRALTQSNNNFDRKAEIWLEERKYAWDAFSKYQGNMVPLYSIGGSNQSSSATNFVDLMGMKAMKDLSLDMGTSNSGGSSSAKAHK